jgi:hypothetical protein
MLDDLNDVDKVSAVNGNAAADSSGEADLAEIDDIMEGLMANCDNEEDEEAEPDGESGLPSQSDSDKPLLLSQVIAMEQNEIDSDQIKQKTRADNHLEKAPS